MKMSVFAAVAAMTVLAAGAAAAESIKDMCVRVSEEWGTQGDVAGQCSCLAELAAGDSALDGELRTLSDAYSNDEEAYEAASDGTKAAFDTCSVNS